MEWSPPFYRHRCAKVENVNLTTYRREATKMKVTTVGIDLAKSVFQVHGVDRCGKCVVRKQLRRSKVLMFFAQLKPCLIGMEACAGAHYWARELKAHGHEVKLIAPQFVKPYVKADKTDAADAEAICEAVARPNMRFVPVKNAEQQCVLSIHRARAGFVKARTAQANQIRGLLGEYGIVLVQGISHLRRGIPEILEDGERDLPALFRQLLLRLYQHLRELDSQVEELEMQIKAWHRDNEDSRRLAKIPGVGALTATALVASIGEAKNFKNGRQLAAWLGLVPRQHSSGGKTRLQGISKRGDVYLRTLIIHGARAANRVARPQRSATDAWTTDMGTRRPKNVVVVARANKNARIAWALLAHQRHYDAAYQPAKQAA
jgi:transposase